MSELDHQYETERFTRKGQATRGRIVAVAAELIHHAGVADTSVDDVQASAGVSASQLYHYFGGKPNLVRAVVAYQSQAMLDGQQPLDSIEALHAWRRLLVDTLQARDCQGGCPVGSLVGQLAEVSAECRSDLADGLRRWEKAIRAGLHAMKARGELRRSADPDKLAVSLMAAIQGGTLLAQAQRDVTPLDVALELAIDHIAELTPRRSATPAV
ncbi:MAG TPA: TetR/AcrR family transcriptional regulator [Polyangiales bacterium]|nr:TetR/AcrR family transcriptional regulator [Polyangiales bacterium]